jgi:hypothetical protein
MRRSSGAAPCRLMLLESICRFRGLSGAKGDFPHCEQDGKMCQSADAPRSVNVSSARHKDSQAQNPVNY